MIGKLSGILDTVEESGLILDVGGVGYYVECADAMVARLPSPGAALTLIIETLIRDERLRLFGFRDRVEREWFRNLLTVQGVGVKLALMIIGTLGSEALERAIVVEDDDVLRQISGVGKRLGRRIVTELRDRNVAGIVISERSQHDSEAGIGLVSGAAYDAILALINLGYGEGESRHVVQEVAARGEFDTARLIRESLTALASGQGKR